jgi:hypothetical protein
MCADILNEIFTTEPGASYQMKLKTTIGVFFEVVILPLIV